MGLKNGNQIIFKMTNVVARELDMMLDLIFQKFATDNNVNVPRSIEMKTMDIDVSNIIHKLAYCHSCIYSHALVKNVAMHIKQIAADTGYIVVPVLDGNQRPQSKRDAFKRRYESTMSRLNSFFCRQAAMKIAAKPVGERTEEEKHEFYEFNKEAKRIESKSSLHVPTSLREDLESALEECSAYFPDRLTGGIVSRQTIQAEFESDYIIAHWFYTGKCQIIYSSDADMTALCGPTCISIRSFGEETGGGEEKERDEKVRHQSIYMN
jgi:hypothetical protein